MDTSVHIATLEALREHIRCLEGGARHERAVLPFGVNAIDERLPEGGLALGALHEVAGGGNGAVDGAAAALFAAGIAARTRGHVLWCVTRQDLFAPALAQTGLAPDRVIYVEAGDEKAVLACFEEALRHPKLGAVVAEVARLSMTASRRLQLAAEGSGVIGLELRRWRRQTEAAEFRQPTAASTHWRISALPSTALPVPGVGAQHLIGGAFPVAGRCLPHARTRSHSHQHRRRAGTQRTPQAEYQAPDRCERMAVDGPISIAWLVRQPGQYTSSHGVPAVTAHRMVGDHRGCRARLQAHGSSARPHASLRPVQPSRPPSLASVRRAIGAG